jgi:hypothetical protein
LAKNPTAKLRVYVIWLVALGGDRRSTWNPDVMPDLRVAHFWDAERTSGAWFAKHVEGTDGYMWDTYLLYGPNAQWADGPSPLLDGNGTIIEYKQQLQEHLTPLIQS